MFNKFFVLISCILLLAGCDNTIHTYRITVTDPTTATFEEYTIRGNNCIVRRQHSEVIIYDNFGYQIANYPSTYNVIVRREEELEKIK